MLYNIGEFDDFVEQPSPLAAPIAKLWYLVRLHPNYDLKAERQLLKQGISVYVPKETRKVKGVWGRRGWREIPIFSGAMFVADFDADLARLKRLAGGIGGFVRCGTEPLKISLAWMDRIRKFEARRQSATGERKFKVDQAVRIVGGHFDLWEGRIERLDNNHRLRVLIGLLQGEVRIEIDEDQVEAV